MSESDISTDHSDSDGASSQSPADGAFCVEVDFDPHVNYAMYQNDVPVVKRIRLHNTSDAAIENLTVQAWIEPGISDVWQARVARIAPEATYNLDMVDLPLAAQRLAEQTERERATLVVEVCGEESKLARWTGRVDVLARCEWPGLRSLPELMAAFVLPNQRAVQQILMRAREHLEQATGEPALSGYQSKDSAHVTAMIQAIYQAVANQNLGYINPPASFESEGQKVRLPEELIACRMGTCLDLALLMAGCFEQAGLHPLIVLLQGHALAAVWLSDQSFADAAIDEPLRVRKRVELGEICVVESTAVTQRPVPTFADAQKAATRRLTDVKQFACAIDIHSARAMSIRPLPEKSAAMEADELAKALPAADDDGAADTATARFSLVDASNSAPHHGSTGEENTDIPASRLDKWKRRLLDLSLNNRVLNYKETKKTIPLMSSSLSAMEDALSNGEHFAVLPRPRLMDENQPRSAAVHTQRTGDDAIVRFLTEELAARRIHADLPEGELENRLLELYRGARTAIEESGVSTLYLAMGFLAWYESESSDIQRLAPILLIPVRLERTNARAKFEFSQSDEEPRINVTLLEKLKADFGLEGHHLEELTADESGLDVPRILQRFRELVKDIDRWDVVERADLGFFSFTKFLMWQDLNHRGDVLAQHSVIRMLLGEDQEDGARPLDEAGFPDPAQLDDNLPPEKTYCPKDADSSQLAAIQAANDGHSFVLQGPPGTGKSQTITNLIAHCLGHGKRVLFVSEKMAALSVVHRRLSEEGLAPFCLELHSHKASKREVINQFGEALAAAGQQAPAEWATHAQQLTASRSALNALVQALHHPRPVGLSVYQATGRLIALRGAPTLHLRIKNPATLKTKHLQHSKDHALRLAKAATTAGTPSQHPLRAIGRGQWQMSLPDSLSNQCQSVQVAVDTFRQTLLTVGEALGLPPLSDASYFMLQWLADFIRLLLEDPRPTPAILIEADWEPTRKSLKTCLASGRQRDQLRRPLLERYQPELFDEDLVVLRGTLANAIKKSVVSRWLGARGVRKKLSLLRCDGKAPHNELLLQDLDTAIAVKRQSDLLKSSEGVGARYIGAAWNQGEADWDRLQAIIAWADRFHQLAASAPGDLGPKHPREWLVQWATERRDQVMGKTPTGRQLAAYVDAWEALLRSMTTIDKLAEVDAELAWGDRTAAGMLDQIIQTLLTWQANIGLLNDWCYWRRTQHDATKAGLNSLVQSYTAGQLRPDEFSDAVERTLLQQWLQAVMDQEDALRQFNSAQHEQRIEVFRDLDRRYLTLSREVLVAKLAANIPQTHGHVAAKSEVGILQRQLKLQRRHMPVRKLMQKLPNLISRLKPCVLMSPLSVAQYLDAEHPAFDLVVFDEASQIPTWDAVGAIARGHSAIVVGDSKQLPPTNFFAKVADESLDGEDDIEELESILDECVASGLPAMRLRWHYRSQHESLIAFSNYYYYDNNLYTFPSPLGETDTLGVSMRYVSNGIYDRGGSRTNQAEAKAIVEEIVKRLSEPGDAAKKSIGVVTFSVPQQVLIEDLLDQARREHPEIEPYFSSDRLEPVFIKNLENVQGDERDTIFFSICYGPDHTGRVAMNFGPLNRDGGQRRLNVAITRARSQVLVFSSIRAEQIDLSRSRRVGVAHLKTFLDYAERGPVAIAEATTLTAGEYESPFERDVAEALEARNWQVDLQVGCSGYRIDLAVRDPQRPGAYLLGIECDGAFYHSGKTARDRDRLRQGILESLGWKLHRIWSRDWWLNPRGELEKLDAILGAAAEAAPVQLIATAPATTEPASLVTEASSAVNDEPENINTADESSDDSQPRHREMAPGASCYKAYTSRRIIGDGDSFYSHHDQLRLRKIIGNILDQEAPIDVNLLTQRLMPLWRLTRQTGRVNRRVQELLAEMADDRQVVAKEGVLWRPDQAPETYLDFRIPTSHDRQPRKIDQIPTEEIANACHAVLKQQISLPLEDLCREIANMFGIARVTERTQNIIQRGVRHLAKTSQCQFSDNGMVALSPN